MTTPNVKGGDWCIDRTNCPTAVGAACIFFVAGAHGGGSSGASTSATKAPIKVLTFGDITGLFPTPQNDLVDAVRAAVNAFNASGGVQGRKVDLITCNTEFNPATASSCVENARTDGVVLAIPSFEIFDSITTPILGDSKIPIFGAPSTAAAAFDPAEACFVPGAFSLYPAGATQMAKAGVKNIDVLEPLGVPNTNEINQAVTMATSRGRDDHRCSGRSFPSCDESVDPGCAGNGRQ